MSERAIPTDPGPPGFRLRLLSCANCGAPLAAEGQDVVYYCTACYSGFRLGTVGDGGRPGAQGPSAEGLVPVEVSFVSLPHAAAERYLPFWLLPGTVSNLRTDKGGSSAFQGLLGLVTGGGAPTGGESREITFAVPAFEASLEVLTRLGERYTSAFPELGERLGEKLTGGRLSPEDAEKLAHFTLIASHVERPGVLRGLSYELSFGPPRLLGVPFVKRGAGLADAVFGIPV